MANNLDLEKLSSAEIAGLALLTCKSLINKQAELNKNLEDENHKLKKIAELHLYEQRLKEVATKLAEAGVIAHSDIHATLEDLREKYASISDIPDPQIVFTEYIKLSEAWGAIDSRKNGLTKTASESDALNDFIDFLRQDPRDFID